MHKLKNCSLPFLLAVLTWLLTILPVLAGKLPGVFFSFEPDVVYVANAISYTQSHQIKYNDHPATPAIWLISKSFIPLRLYAKYLAKTPFIHWSIQNQAFLYLYERIFQSLILGFAALLFLSVIKKHTQSTLSVFFAWAALLTFQHFPYLGSVIASEATSFLILSTWFWLFSLLVNKQNPRYLPTLAFLAGLATANKFTNLFYIFISLGLVITVKPSFKTAVVKICQGIVFSSLGFLLGTWPIRSSYPGLFNWVARLATTSSLHGTGSSKILDLPVYLNSAKILIYKETWPVIISLFFLIFLVYKIIHRQVKPTSPLVIAGSSALLGMLIFAKYPLSHYQLPNFYVIVFILGLTLNSLKSYWLRTALVVALIFAARQNINKYYQNLSTQIAGTINMENQILNHPAQIAAVWEFASVRDYTLIHSRDWIGGFYTQKLNELRPDLLSLTTDLKQIKNTKNELQPTFSVCWDKLYIQQEIALSFLKLHSDRPLKLSLIEHSEPRNMALIESDHCQ